MYKKIFIAIVFALLVLGNTTPVSACDSTDNSLPNHGCQTGFYCLPSADPKQGNCMRNTVQSIFGKVEPPDPLKGFLQEDPTGAGAISQFLSNFIALLFSVAGIVLIFMLVWGALQWMLSGGDKEKLASARSRIINAIIGLILFAAAFAIIRIIGQFTGFTFFKDTGIPPGCVRSGNTYYCYPS